MQSGVNRVVGLVHVLHLNLQLLPLVLQEGVAQGVLGCYSLAWVAGQHLLEQVAAGWAQALEELRVEV